MQYRWGGRGERVLRRLGKLRERGASPLAGPRALTQDQLLVGAAAAVHLDRQMAEGRFIRESRLVQLDRVGLVRDQ
jgi:hypothetical protein